jgi:hypothetical protein
MRNKSRSLGCARDDQASSSSSLCPLFISWVGPRPINTRIGVTPVCTRDDHLYELAAEDLQVGRQEGEKNHGTSAGALVRFADPEHTPRWVLEHA